MRQLNAAYHLYDGVRNRINDVNCGSSAVRDVDERPAVRFMVGSRTSAADPICESKPVRVILSLELPATRVECIPACFWRQRVYQEQAGTWITRSNKLCYC